MNIRDITYRYYSKFCCYNLSEVKKSLTLVQTEERNKEMRGFGCAFTIYAFKTNDRVVISFIPQYLEQINGIRNQILKQETKEQNVNESLETINQKDFITMLLAMFPKMSVRKLFVYVGNKHIDTGKATKLTRNDYQDYENFFLKVYPNALISDGWLKNYFFEKADKGYMFGYYEDGILVSVSDAPDMPYMTDIIQHTGIATLKEYREKGYAKKVSFLATQELIKRGICPQWEAEEANIASINLAKSIGYEEVAEAYVLEE